MAEDSANEAKNKGGRPRRIITDEHLRQIEVVAGLGLTMPEIARVIGISPETLKRRKRDMEEVEEAIAVGKAKAAMSVSRKLYQLATEGSIPAIIWYERTRCGRTEKSVVEHVGMPQQEQSKVVVVLPHNNRDDPSNLVDEVEQT